jgi:hypothetical protein
MKLVYYSHYESLPYAIVKRFAESVLQKEYFTEDDEKRMNRVLLHKKRYSSFTGLWHLHLETNGLLQQEWWVEPLVQNEEEIRAKLEEHKQDWEEKLTSSGLTNLIRYAKAVLICNQLGLPLDDAHRVIYYGDDLVDLLFSVNALDDIDLKPSWIEHNEKYPNPKGAQSQFCLNYFNRVLIEAKVFNPSKYTSKADNQYYIFHRAGLKVSPLTLNDALSIMSLARPKPRKDAYFTSPKFNLIAQNAIIDWLINEWDVQEYSHIPISNQERFIQRFPGLGHSDFGTIKKDLIQSGIVDGPFLSEGTLLTRDKETIQHRLRCYLESGLSDERKERTDREYDTTKSEAIFREKIRELNQSSIVNIPNCNSPRELIQFMLNHNFEIFRLSRRESAIIYARGLIFPLILGFLFPYAGFLLFCIQALRCQKKIRESQARIENSSEAEEVWRKIEAIIPFIPAST